MLDNEAAERRTVALYWDFENIHAGLCEEREPGAYARGDFRFRPQEPLVDVQAIVDLAASLGPIAINRAYCNWQFFSRYRDALLQNAVELIQLFPPGGAAKNGADIKLCLDATEDIGRFSHIGTVLIVGGDSDFMPVAQKIKAAGRTLIGIGTRKATNRHWARSCHEFRYYENLVEAGAQAAAAASAAPPAPVAGSPAASAAPAAAGPDAGGSAAGPTPAAGPAGLVRRALRLLAAKRHAAWIEEAELWPLVKRLEPTFDPAEHGYANLAAMLQALDALVEVREGPGGRQVRLR